MIKRVALIGIFIAELCCGAAAQNSTSSPYTRHGFGNINESGFGQSISMGGLSSGLRSSQFTNPANPASYTAIDSLNFRIEAGIGLMVSKFSDSEGKDHLLDGNLEHLAVHFPIKKWVALSLGIRPYSIVGYNSSYQTTKVTEVTGDTLVSQYNYTGKGGINQLYLGLGFRPWKAFSVGANLLYHFGTIEHNSAVTFNKDYSYRTLQTQEIRVRDLCANFGAQGTISIKEDQSLTLGVTYQFKSEIKSEASKTIVTTDTTVLNYDNNFDTPHAFGMGFVYQFNRRLLVGFDYKRTLWSGARFFGEKPFEDVNSYIIGAQYLPDPMSRKYYQRMYYRCGVNVSKTYYKVNDERLNKFTINAGIGFPLKKGLDPTVINVGFEYGQNGKTDNGLVKEQSFKGTISATINERWFVKRRLD